RAYEMRAIGDRLYEAVLPGVTRTIEYAFECDGAVSPSFRVSLRDLPEPPPSWWRDAVVYTIFVDRFAPRRRDRWDRDTRCGGDLDGITAALPYLADLGVTVLHLTPITP